MLKISIEDLTFNCIIGILPSERTNEQKVIVNISFEYFYKDDGSNFIDYSEIVSLVEEIMVKKEFTLIENAIIFVRKELKNNYKIKNLKIKISKPDILPNCVVSIEE